MHLILYLLAGLFFFAALGAIGTSTKLVLIYGLIGASFFYWGNSRKSIRKDDIEKETNVVQNSDLGLTAARLTDLVNESLKLADKSKNADTKLSRLAFAKENLSQLKKLASDNPALKLAGLDQVEADIERLEFEFQLAGYKEAAEGNMRGQSLEKEGKIDEAISVYEKLLAAGIDTPFSYRRLAIIYRKQKMKDDEIRVLKAAIKNVPSTNAKHYQWFAERLANMA